MRFYKHIVIIFGLLTVFSSSAKSQQTCNAVQIKLYPTDFRNTMWDGAKRKLGMAFNIQFRIIKNSTYGQPGSSDTVLFDTKDRKCYTKFKAKHNEWALEKMEIKSSPFYATLCFEGDADLSDYYIEMEYEAYGWNQRMQRKNKPQCNGGGHDEKQQLILKRASLAELNSSNSTIVTSNGSGMFSYKTMVERMSIPYPQFSMPEHIQVCKNERPYVLRLQDYTYKLNMAYFSDYKTTIKKKNGSSWDATEYTNSALLEFPFEDISDAGTYAVYTKLNGDCEMADTFTLSFLDTAQVIFTRVPPICQNGVDTIIVAKDTINKEYVWSDAYGNCLSRYKDLMVEDTGVYTLKVTRNNGCYSRFPVHVDMKNNVVVNFAAPEIYTCFNVPTAITLAPLSTSFSTYKWGNGATTSGISVTRPGMYRLTTTDADNCVSTASVSVVDTCIEPVHQDVRPYSWTAVVNKVDFENTSKNKVLLLDPRSISGNITYGAADIVKRTTFVRLQYHRNAMSDTRDSIWTLSVPYQIKVDGQPAENRTLEIRKTAGGEDVYESIFEHAGGDRIEVEINEAGIIVKDRNDNTLDFDDIPQDINLEVELRVLHIPEFVSGTSINSGLLQHTADNVNKKLTIYWEPVRTAVEYEIEWVFVDKLDKEQTVDDAMFKRKGWTLLLAENAYTLDATFPAGKLAYRVRPVGRKTAGVGVNYNHPITGNWSSIKELTLSSDGVLSAFEPDKNWSKVITFAEEGKKKEVVSYMDATLRTKQVLTNLNTEAITLAAETYYDHEARGTLQVLPTPVFDNNLLYKSGLSLYSGNPVDKSVVDNEIQLPLDNTSGASYYYSSASSSQLSTLFGNKIPVNTIPYANGYVTTKVEYSRDNTGRVVKQSGVGSEFIIDETNGKHYTRYFYNTPTQTELNRLFGSNVGEAVYYSKTMTVDPNGQVSVSYLDNKDRTIATALSGDAPANVEAIEKPAPVQTTYYMGNNNVRDSLHRVSTSVNIITNDKVNKEYEFYYEINAAKDLQTAYCKDCKYKVELSVTDPKGNPVFLTAASLPSYAKRIENEENDLIKIEGILDTALCANLGYTYPEIVFNATFTQLGNYVYTKKLTLLEEDEASIDDYLSLINFPTREEFIEENIGKYIDTLACRNDCESRLLMYLRDVRREDSLTTGIKPEIYYNSLKDSLRNAGYCDPFLAAQFDAMEYAEKRCDDLLNNMVRQVSPGEKYFDTKTYPIIQSPNGSVRDSLIAWGILSTDNSKNAVIARWQDDWGRKLVLLYGSRIHPEYCHYENCINDTVYNAFDIKMGLMSGFKEAQAKGYISGSLTSGYSFGTVLNNEIALLESKGIDINPLLNKYINIRRNGGNTTYLLSSTGAHVRFISIIDAVKPRNIYYNPAYPTIADSGYYVGKLYYPDSLSYDINGNGIVDNPEWDSAFWIRFSAAFLAVKKQALMKYHETNGCGYLQDEEALVKNPNMSVGQAQAQVQAYNTQQSYCSTCPGKSEAWTMKLERECRAIRNHFRDYPLFRVAVKDSLYNYCMRSCGQMNPQAIISHNDILDGQLTPLANFIVTYVTGADTCNILGILDEGVIYNYEKDSSGQTIIRYVCEESACSLTNIVSVANKYGFNYPKTDSLIYREGFDGGDSTVFYANSIYKNKAQHNGIILNKNSTAYVGHPYVNYATELGDATGDTLGYMLYNYTQNMYGTPPRYDSVFWGTVSPIAVQPGIQYLISYSLANISFGNIDIRPVIVATDTNYTDTLQQQMMDTISCVAGWNRFQYLWTPPAGVDTIHIRMYNKEWKFYGNDFLFDEFRVETIADTAFEILGCDGFKPHKMNIANGEINIHYEACNNTSSGGGLYTLFFVDSTGQRIPHIDFAIDPKYHASSPLGSLPVYPYRNVSFGHYSYLLSVSDSDYVRGYLYIASCATPKWTIFNEGNNQLDIFYILLASGELGSFNSSYLNSGTNYHCNRTFDTCTLRPQVTFLPPPPVPCDSSIQCLNAQWQPDTSIQSCIDRQILAQQGWLTQRYTDSLYKVLTAYQTTHIAKCFKDMQETFYYKTMLDEYHYTLYYYDQGGNLVQTIPPAGVYPVPPSGFDIEGKWLGGTANEPKHVLKTIYQYNTRQQPVAQHTPDGGLTKYWYNKKGQLRLSQNEEQKSGNRFSFTHYDPLGRIDLVGEIVTPDKFYYSPTGTANRKDTLNRLVNQPNFPLNFVGMSGYQLINLVQTEYDAPTPLSGLRQENLHNRVSATYSYNTYADLQAGAGIATIYSYDEVGNVKTLVQDMSHYAPLADLAQNADAEQLKKQVDYAYDLVSGKVNAVVYNNGEEDEFRHRYEYDADNRITDVYTSDKNGIEQKEAKYFYLPHGPLARVEFGHDKVQMTDYAYTLQGWLKSLNKLPQGTGLHARVGKRQLAYQLGYYKNDYASSGIGSSENQSEFGAFAPHYNGLSTGYKGLYNGNIAYTLNVLEGLGLDEAHYAGQPKALGMQYRYDQLHRILEAKGQTTAITGISMTPSGLTIGSTAFYKGYETRYSYDANGNIKKLDRTAPNYTVGLFEQMDSLLYYYGQNNYSGTVKLLNNRLYHVGDRQSDSDRFAQDLDHQLGTINSVVSSTTAPNTNIVKLTNSNYEYDKTGQLKKDLKEGIQLIVWTPYGKIDSIAMSAPKSDLKFHYDATGNRVAKLEYPKPTAEHPTPAVVATYYFRDAQGNILDVVQPKVDGEQYTESHEYSLYGSSRLGTMTIQKNLSSGTGTVPKQRKLGQRQYELSNHLGNVMTTLTDQKYYSASTSQYEPAVTSVTDYYPFGMPMPGRTLPYSYDTLELCQSYDSTSYSVRYNQTYNGTGSGLYGWQQSGVTAAPSTTGLRVTNDNSLSQAGIYIDQLYENLPNKRYKVTYVIDSVANSGNTGTETKTYFAAYAGSECGGAWNNPIGLVPLSNGTHVIEYMGTGYGSTRFALITEQANATWKLKSFKIEEKRFTPKTSCGVIIPIDNKDYNSNTTPLFTASTASTTVSVPATPTPKRVVITGSIAAGAAPAQFGASLSFSTTVGKVYTIYLENVSLETTNLAPSYQNYTGYAVVNHPADAGDEGKMLTNGSLGYTSCYKGYAITFVARATTTWLMLGGMVAAQDAGQAASVSVQLQKLRIVGSQPIRRTVQLLADKRYRFGFNGMEKDDEVKGSGNSLDFGARIYDSRLGKWLSKDKVTKSDLSSYEFSRNSPITFMDPDGNNEFHFYYYIQDHFDGEGKVYQTIQFSTKIIQNNQEHTFFIHNGSLPAPLSSTTQIYPFQSGTALENRNGYQASKNNLPLSNPITAMYGLITKPITDYVYLGTVLKMNPEVLENVKQNDNTWYIPLKGAETTSKTFKLGQKAINTNEFIIGLIDGYYALKSLGKLAFQGIARSFDNILSESELVKDTKKSLIKINTGSASSSFDEIVKSSGGKAEDVVTNGDVKTFTQGKDTYTLRPSTSGEPTISKSTEGVAKQTKIRFIEE